MYNTKKERSRTSWSAIYDPKNKGKITIPDNPIQIADAALYLSKTQALARYQGSLRADQTQFDATVALLKKQKPLVKKYWVHRRRPDRPVQERRVDPGGELAVPAVAAPGGEGAVSSVIPKEGVTGWLDTWMPSAKAKHPNCAYMWMNYITSPKAQAQQATNYGETPVNKKACPLMDKLVKGSCAQYSANRPESYYRTIKFWKTPLADCGNGKKDCVPYTKWVTAWNARCWARSPGGGETADRRGGLPSPGSSPRALSARVAAARAEDPGPAVAAAGRVPLRLRRRAGRAARLRALERRRLHERDRPHLGFRQLQGAGPRSGLAHRGLPHRRHRRAVTVTCIAVRSRTPTSWPGSRPAGCGSSCWSPRSCRSG